MVTVQNETLSSLYDALQINKENITPELEQLASAESRYLKDLKINVQNALNFSNLTKKESYLLALATALNEKHLVLREAFGQLAEQEGATKAELAEIVAIVSLLNVNNVFYRFRHFTNKDFGH